MKQELHSFSYGEVQISAVMRGMARRGISVMYYTLKLMVESLRSI